MESNGGESIYCNKTDTLEHHLFYFGECWIDKVSGKQYVKFPSEYVKFSSEYRNRKYLQPEIKT